MLRPIRLAVTISLGVPMIAATATAADPALSLRLEAGGASGLRDEVSDHGLAVHFGGRVTYAFVPVLAAGVRIGGSFFPPAGTAGDISHSAYAVGLTARPVKGLWADGYLGLHNALDDSGIGFELGAGYDLPLGSSAGVGPFVGYSLAALDETQHFLQFGVGGSFGLTGPRARASGDGGDPDGDRITGDDRCPDEAEDVDQHEDADGCPDPDDDGDRIPDASDECRAEAEDLDEHEDENGCPDLDDDSDQVPDTSDRCRTEAEDRDQWQDEDGCPDPDNDSDQAPDASDRCPAEPEDRDGFQDDDGCPDADNDGDGKADAQDQCPNEPQSGTATDGCPQRVRVDATSGAVRLVEAIRFRGANVDPASAGVLDDLAAILKAPNAPARVSVRVFAHPAGAPAALIALTQRRADALKAALVQRQVPAERIEATGAGGDAPLAQGNTADARRQNERVEVVLHRTAAPAPTPASGG